MPVAGVGPEWGRYRNRVRKALYKYFRAKGCSHWKTEGLIHRWIKQKGWREPCYA